jgi:hypothetical protein
MGIMTRPFNEEYNLYVNSYFLSVMFEEHRSGLKTSPGALLTMHQNVKRLPTIALSAGFTQKVYTVNLCSLSKVKDPQRLNAKDLSWLVGFIEGDGCFSVNKNGKYAKYELAIIG